MATAKQIEANRRNAQRSTGPRTLDGKARTRLNALVHGLRMEEFELLPNENREAYVARLTRWIEDLEPVGAVEEHLVRHAVDITWKLDRANAYETVQLTARVKAAEGPQELAMFDPSAEGERIRRYQFSLSRELKRTLDTLAKHKRERQRSETGPALELEMAPCGVPPEPVPLSNEELDADVTPIEAISEANVQLLFATDRPCAVEPAPAAATTEANRPRIMTQRDRALARMIKKATARR